MKRLFKGYYDDEDDDDYGSDFDSAAFHQKVKAILEKNSLSPNNMQEAIDFLDGEDDEDNASTHVSYLVEHLLQAAKDLNDMMDEFFDD